MFRLHNLFLFAILALTTPGFMTGARQEEPTPPGPVSTLSATETPGSAVQIISPKEGQALQGSIPVVVDTTIANFQGVELTFGYMDDPTETWFWIYQGLQPVTGTMLVLWDTSTLTDGDYKLRLQVSFLDGSQRSVTVENLRVRNYTPIETNTPAPATSTPLMATSTSTASAPAAVQATAPAPTPESVLERGNPLSVSRESVLSSAGLGILTVVALFVLGLVYQAARTLRRK